MEKEFSFDEIWTPRRLRGVSVESFRQAVLSYMEANLKDFEIRLLKTTFGLQKQHLCARYKYTSDDFLLIKEGLRIFTQRIPIKIRKLISDFEEAHNIKTIWADKDERGNLRGQHFKIEINDR